MTTATDLISMDTETNTRAVMLSYAGRNGETRYISLETISESDRAWAAIDSPDLATEITHLGETDSGVPVTMSVKITGRSIRDHHDLGSVRGIRASVRFLGHSFDDGYEMSAPIAAVAYEGDA